MAKVMPAGAVASTLEPLDAGDATSWDALSRRTEQRRGDPSLAVSHPTYDLGGRPAEEKVGQRAPLGWAWDIYDWAIETRLPPGGGRGAGAFTGFARQFDSLDRLKSLGALGGEPGTVPLGADWSWGGAGRLWGMTTKGSLGTAVRFGYLGGAGAQPGSGNADEAKWQRGTMTWGSMPGADPEATATQSPVHIWGQFAQRQLVLCTDDNYFCASSHHPARPATLPGPQSVLPERRSREVGHGCASEEVDGRDEQARAAGPGSAAGRDASQHGSAIRGGGQATF